MATTQNGIYYQDDYTKNADILADMKEMAESVDEVVQEEKENQEIIEQKIQELQTEQTAQNKKIQEIDDNQIHITTEKANNINIKDASGQNAKIKVHGISKQKTSTQGNNYFDINRANFQKGSIEEDGVTINSSSDNYYTENYIELDKAKYFLYEVESNDYNRAFIYDNNKNFVRSVNTRGTSKQTPLEIDLADNEKYIRFHYYTAETTNRKIMLSKDSAKDYEEFVPDSPSPKYPSKIENTGDNINYFDISKITNKGALTNNGDGSLTMQNNENTLGFIQINQTLKQLCPELKAGDIIAFSFKTTTQNSTYKDRIYAGDFLFNGESKEITQAMLDAYVCFYGGYNEISTISNIKIEKGTKVTSYSKYKCGSIGITVCNKNWLKVQNSNNSSLGLTWNVSEEERKITGTATSTYSQSSQQDCEIPAGSYKFEYETNNNNVTYGIWLINSTGQIIATIRGKDSATINETVVKYALFIENTVANTSYNITLKAMLLNTVTEDKTFVPHKEQAITFPLGEGQRLYNGDYLASDGIHHKRTQVKIKGIETQWIYYSANDVWARPYLTLTNKKIGESNNTANALCNKAKSISWEEMAHEINEVSVFTYEGDNRISITIKKEDLETQDVEGVKKYFQKNNMIVEYNLAKETVEAYTEEQQEAYNQLQNAKTYKTVTNVFTENAEIDMEYVAHTKTYIDNKVNNMQNQLNTINELLSTTNTSALLLNNLQTDLESEVL